MATSLPEQSQWDQFYSALANSAQLRSVLNGCDGKVSAFQFAGPLLADWTTGADIGAHDFGNHVPQNLDGFYAPGGNLFNAYRDLVLSIKQSDKQSDPRWIALHKQYDDKNVELTAANASLRQAWTSYVQQHTSKDGKVPNQQDWESDPLGGKPLMDRIAQIQQVMGSLTTEMSAIVKQENPALGAAQAALYDKTYYSNYVMPDQQTQSLPRINVSGNLATQKSTWDEYPADQYDLTSTLRGHATIKTPWRTVYDVESHQHCLDHETSTKVDTRRIITDEDYALTLKIKGLASFAIDYGGWFDETFVNTDVKLNTESGVTPDQFWGLHGSLHMIPSEVIVAYQPSMTLRLSKTVYEQQIEVNANASIDFLDLFSFRFAVDGLSSLKPVEVDPDVMQIEFSSPTYQNPTILGVVSSVRWNGNA